VASAFWISVTLSAPRRVFETGSLAPETQTFSSASRSKWPAVSTEKRVIAF
jgi:hypothetical protein